ncbi:MAG: glycoside hydrolase family 65 protein [Saprospiraceae bacterium]|nr:glycoside hydrolase family 65 protein [Bacteroidia bacterium]NNE14324.1 glycoside hydrolase family 65 protein [Saprospiraceae bacterium]
MRYLKYFLTIIIFIFFYHINAQSPWVVEANDIDPNNYYGVTVANGVIGVVSAPEPMKVSDVILNGVYDYYQRGRVSNILKTFNHLNMNLDIDGMRISQNNINNYQQSLDMKSASLNTSFEVGNKAKVMTTMMALRHLPYTSMIEVEITAIDDIKITPMSVIEAPNHLNDVRNYYAEIDRPHVKIPLMTSVGLSPSGRIKVAASNSFIFSEDHGNEPDLIHEDWDYNMHLTKFHKHLAAGESYKFYIVASACASTQYEDPHNEVERLTIFAALEGADNLLKKHKNAWDDLWTSNITVEGNIDVTRDIRFALYHLYSFSREGTAYSLSPMGLSGLGYNGHVFWDTELWMYPPLLMLKPEIAKSLLEYRFQRLEAAKQNAFSHGYKGAMFPWESAGDGSEDTPVWALTGPFEHHISGCIAWAFWKYYQVTKDKDWLEEKGYPVISAVADFWASRVERNGPGAYNIKNVVGADEWAENIDDNAFTNAVAILSLKYATEAAQALNKKPDPDWNHVAINIPILKMENGVTNEHATYKGEEIKQADVNLLAYPLGLISDKDQIKKDLDYYQPRMSPNGPAMGAAILSILYNRLGENEKASSIFSSSYKLNEVPPFGVISETAGGTNPYFATGAGGMLQAVLSGFGGLSITNNGIEQTNYDLPHGWQKLIIEGVGIEKKRYEISK